MICRVDDYAALCATAADTILHFLSERPRATIALPAGKTPAGVYDQLRQRLREHPVDLSHIHFVNLDEVVGLPPDHPMSFARILRECFLDRAELAGCSYRLLDGSAADLDAESERHEESISSHGGLDLAILGIGVNGHLAFNEPGTAFEARTHVVALTEASLRGLQLPAALRAQLPGTGITLGLANLLEARHILLLASGRAKAHAVRELLDGPVTERLPASILRHHSNWTTIADDAACVWIDSENRDT